MVSYSEADRKRFIAWLRHKYGTVAALNKAWATQRWSRHLNTWDEVRLPYIEGPGPYERYLDMRRFWSEQTIGVLELLEAVRKKNVPDKPAISNLWDSAGRKGFDYLATYRNYVSYGAMGFYPGDPLSAGFESTMMRAGMNAPIWFNEFTAGGPAYYGTPGRSRMWARAHGQALVGRAAPGSDGRRSAREVIDRRRLKAAGTSTCRGSAGRHQGPVERTVYVATPCRASQDNRTY